MAQYKRILLKLSGEALGGDTGIGFDAGALEQICGQVKGVHEKGVEVGIVVGAGNIFRGMPAAQGGMNRVTGDQMGMLGTMINGLALMDRFEGMGITTNVLSARAVEEFIEPFDLKTANRYLSENHIVIFVGGTGNPFFTTDTAAALRAIQIQADVLLKGTKVDGVYDADPAKVPSAKKYETVTYSEVLSKDLRVMDATAIALCRENSIPIEVFNLTKKGTLLKVIKGEKPGTSVTQED